MTVGLSPVPIQDFYIGGAPSLGAKVFIYSGGSTTKITTYTDSTGTVPQVNPILTNARGEPQNSMGASVGIWVPSGTTYKVVFASPTDTDPPTTPIWTVDGLASPSAVVGGGNIINASGTTLAQGQQYGFKTSVSALSATLPDVTTVTPGSSIRVFDVDNNAVNNNITINAHSGQTISDSVNSSSSAVINVSNLPIEFVSNTTSWRVYGYGPALM